LKKLFDLTVLAPVSKKFVIENLVQEYIKEFEKYLSAEFQALRQT
jgi:hypothetical protein